MKSWNKAKPYFRILNAFCLAFIMIFLPLFGAERGAAETPGAIITIYFYNSDVNLNNYSAVKARFDRYLSQFGAYRFQPFNKEDIFENVARTMKAPGVLVLSSRHYRALNQNLPMTPLLIGLRKGKNCYRKNLLAKSPLSNIQELREAVVASSGSREGTHSLLKEMIGQGSEDIVSTIRVLEVPKDIDALFSMDFGLARCAVATKESVRQMEEHMGRKSPLVPLYESQEIMMPVAVALKSLRTNEAVEKLLGIMKQMKADVEGRECLALLSIDEWTDIDPKSMERLDP